MNTTLTDFPVGTRASFEVDIDADLIERFAQVSGDHNPLHMDEDYGASTFLGGRVAHGMISGALFSRLVGEHLPGERALYRSQEIKFVRPIRPNTAVRVVGEVLAIDLDLNVLTIETTVRDCATDEVYVTGEAEVILRVENPEQATANNSTSPQTLAGHNLLVLGGSSGIGRAVTTELATAGANIAFSYNSRAESAAELQEEVQTPGRLIETRQVQLEDPSSVARFAETFERIDGIVLAAFGEIPQRGITRGNSKDLADALERSVVPSYDLVQKALPRLTRGASIVFLGSSVTLEPPPPMWTAYTVAKSALQGLARSLAVELGPRGIRVNTLSPSLTLTDKNQGLPPRILDDLRARSPLGRLAEPSDIARAVRFLLSDESSFITGVNLPVTGGGVML